MTYLEALNASRGEMGPYCKSCPICNGNGCKNTIPGPGAKGSGTVFIKNYNAWQSISLVMDTLTANSGVDTSYNFYGHKLELPLMAAPVGGLKLHYGNKYDDLEYARILVPACKKAGIAAFTGDGTNNDWFKGAAEAIKENEGYGVPTIKPWNEELIKEKMALALAAAPLAIAMDVDAAGLPFLKNMTPPAGGKSTEELARIVKMSNKPFIVKGIMSVKGALKALEAGASGIVVSNHGGRVLDGTAATATVLPEIAEAVKGKMTILVDGGIRSGLDIFRALALGADCTLIARPFVNMVFGGGEEGVKAYVDKLKSELEDAMNMCGAHNLSEITRDMVRL